MQQNPEFKEKYHILNIALDVPLGNEFSYTHDTDLPIGTKVTVEFINKICSGFIISRLENIADLPCSIEKLKPILKVWTAEYTIPQEILSLVKFSSKYYHYPLGQSLFTALPKYMRSSIEHEQAFKTTKPHKSGKSDEIQIALNTDQQNIVDKISENFASFYPSLIYGITGSGKTEVYLELIAKILSQGKQILVLVPEINLTPQLMQRFTRRFPEVNMHILHSAINDKKRFTAWQESLLGKTSIIIATRLGVFTPFDNLGMIIIDEEHDGSFKQNEGLRYHARDIAIWRAKQLNIPIILGSATPSLETLYNYHQNKLHLFKLDKRAVANAHLPQIQLINLNHQPQHNGLSILAINKIQECLSRNEMALIFLNRRGYAPIISCYECGWVSSCKHCSTKLVYHGHNGKKHLKCHHCGYSTKPPLACPKCNNPYLHTIGQGTQKMEETLAKLFPQAKVTRVDQDTTNTKAAWDKLYNKINNNEVDILLGTQMLAKGHDFHKITLVVAVNIDSGLHSYDFRASEDMYQQLTQVAGRAGRGDKAGTVLLHTYYPQHELYQYLLNHDFNAAVNFLMLQRRQLHLPPYSYYAILKASASNITKVMDYLNQTFTLLQQLLQQMKLSHTNVYQPVPAVMQRLKNRERGQILIQSKDRQELHALLKNLADKPIKQGNNIHFVIDVDPYEV